MNTASTTSLPNKNILYLLVALSSTLGLFQFFSPALIHSFSFWPDAINHIQLWRLFTAHLIHFNLLHFALNLLGTWLIIFLFFGESSARKTFLIFCGCFLGVDLGLYLFSPSNQEYIGLSGVLHGLAVAGALTNKIYAAWKRYFFVFLISAKVCYENFFVAKGDNLGLHYDFIVATDAHAYGLVSGLLITLSFFFVNQLNAKIH